MIISRADPYCFAGEWFHGSDSNKLGQKRSDRADDHLFWLENCSMASWIKPNSNAAKGQCDTEIEMNRPLEA